VEVLRSGSIENIFWKEKGLAERLNRWYKGRKELRMTPGYGALTSGWMAVP
jgi:hypothetical protein